MRGGKSGDSRVLSTEIRPSGSLARHIRRILSVDQGHLVQARLLLGLRRPLAARLAAVDHGAMRLLRSLAVGLLGLDFESVVFGINHDGSAGQPLKKRNAGAHGTGSRSEPVLSERAAFAVVVGCGCCRGRG